MNVSHVKNYINVVLGIDDLLAIDAVSDDKFENRDVSTLEQAYFFQKNGEIISESETYYIFPGVREFIQLLIKTENIRVSFFSPGTDERNTEFVDELLKRVLTPDEYEIKRPWIQVLTSKDMVQCTSEEKEEMKMEYGLYLGNHQKDIKKVLDMGGLLENTVSIDDNKSQISYRQEKNILLASSTNHKSFSKLISKIQKYTPDGYKFLECILLAHESDLYKEPVHDGIAIKIFKTQDGFKVCFVNTSFEYQEKIISEEVDSELVFALNGIYQNNLDETGRSVIKDDEVLKNIRDFVTSFDGRIKKICRSANRICYVTGLLFSALKEAEENNIPVSDVLFDRQFKYIEAKNKYKLNEKSLRKRDDLYISGLLKLKEINPDLEFITPHNYGHFIEEPIPESDEKELEHALKKQAVYNLKESKHKKCLMM